jgi:hypothetical protein
VLQHTEFAAVTENGGGVFRLVPELLAEHHGIKRMRISRFIPLFAIVVAVAPSMTTSAAGSQDQPQQTRQEKKSQKRISRGDSLTGCVDQQGGHYVLLDDHSMKQIAELQAVGFPDEGFAKHMGHKVTVRGIRIADSAPTRFQVRAIEPVSDRCTPQDSQQPRK